MGDCSLAAEEREVAVVEEEEEEEEEKVFVAVGSDVDAGKSVLEWAIRRFEGRKICLVHVHRPKRSSSVVLSVCERTIKVDADTWWIEMDNIAKGIVKLIVQYNIKYLVMGAASVNYDSSCLVVYIIQEEKTDEPQALDESPIRSEFEEDLLEALIKAEEFEHLWAAEKDRKHELEKVLAETIKDVEKMKTQNDEYMKQIQLVREKILVLESQLAESNDEAQELQEKMATAVKLLISFKGKRDHMREEYGNIVRKLHTFQNQVNGHALSLNGLPNLTATFSEIIDATQNFNPARKIGEGRNGSVYQGLLGHMVVAIKMLPDYGTSCHLRFLQEVEVISQVRHPHLVTLFGSCPDSRSLIYEYLENGSLEDRLACKRKNTPPLSWQTRIRIAAETCSVLLFLHSNKPLIIHGNLKPSNVHLGAGLVSKISDLGASRLVHVQQTENSANSNPPSEYTDPEFLETGQLTPQSDIYSFGVILLRLLTGMQGLGSGVHKNVTCALENGNIELIVDASAGKWPSEVTEQLLYIALRCCEKKGSDRPDLASEVRGTLEEMRKSCIPSTSCGISKEDRRPPSQFVCPIYQDVFEDPKIAADGYTYEGEAIEGWLNSGHNTSPMTNLKLEHTTLIPNYALHYAIQEWQQKF
ncbi:hypothetical protein QQ045_021808 [Rhodiola kirilowii]